MQAKVDYLSFTVALSGEMPELLGYRWSQVQAGLRELIGDLMDIWIEAITMWEDVKGRNTFKRCMRNTALGVSIFWSNTIAYALVEIAGRGCDALREKNVLEPLLEAVQRRVTRVDVCTDIKTDTTPKEFIAAGYNKRLLSNGSFTSKTGDTEYVGARTSDRFARVYKYNAPHPRAGFLRVEHQYKKKYAKEAVALIVEKGVLFVCVSMGNAFGWKHEEWQPEIWHDHKIKLPAHDRELAKTETWLRTTVASSFVKLVKNRQIENPEEWLREHFLSKLDTKTD